MHRDGKKSCYFLSCGILVLTLLWIKVGIYLSDIYHNDCGFGCRNRDIFILHLLEQKNKPLEEEEKKALGKKVRIIVVAEMIVGMVFLIVNKKAAHAVLSAVIWCGVSYLAWSVKRYTEKNEKNREDNN